MEESLNTNLANVLSWQLATQASPQLNMTQDIWLRVIKTNNFYKPVNQTNKSHNAITECLYLKKKTLKMGVPGEMKINLYQLNKCYKVLHLRSQKLLYYTNMNQLAAL